MSQDTYPANPIEGKVVSEVSDSPADETTSAITLNKNLELRVQTDMELRSSIEALILEIRELKEFLQLVVGR